MSCNHYFVLFVIARFICGIANEVVNVKVVQEISVETQLVKINSAITIKNMESEYINKFTYTVDPYVRDFYGKFKDESHQELKCLQFTQYQNRTQHGFQVFLNRNLFFNKTYLIKVQIVYINRIVPLYKTIRFKQDHLVLYTGNFLYYSPYETLSLENSYFLGDVEDLQLSHLPNHEFKNGLVFSHKNVRPFTFEEVRMEFKNNNPFVVVTNLERFIDISHYGKICVEERIDMKNAGSKLVGPYEPKRSDIDATSDWWYTHLPATVEHVEYFDTIGLNSKSALLYFENYTTLKFQPRFPLLNGWKTFYVIKYCVSAFEYLYSGVEGNFVLQMRTIDHILDDSLVEKVTVKILLPEAARIIKTQVPFGFTRLENEKHYTSLCIFGRPTIVLNGSNILENHIANFVIHYSFSPVYLLRVPLVLVLYLETIFLFFIMILHIRQ